MLNGARSLHFSIRREALLVKGADYTREEVVGGDVVEAAGGTVMLVDLVLGHSTTGLVRRSAESTS
jgi:D-beta-D-heptose 7-phosphate kinase / D-beta-D-heptose 1-phosphate adenosyltransferase